MREERIKQRRKEEREKEGGHERIHGDTRKNHLPL